MKESPSTGTGGSGVGSRREETPAAAKAVRTEKRADLLASGSVDDGLVPFQRWKELPGRQVGLLLTLTNPWGRAIDWSGAISPVGGGYGPATYCYYFYADGASAQALFFISDGRGENFIKNWNVPLPGGTATNYDAAMFGPKTPNTWGLHAQAHIVNLEVNGARGAPVGDHFVATDAVVLDGTKSLPIDPTKALGEARQRYDAWVRDAMQAVDQALAEGEKAVGGHVGTVKRETAEGFFPTWDNQAQELRVLFVRRETAGSSKQIGMEEEVSSCPKNIHPPPPCLPPRRVMTFDTRDVSVEYGMQVTFDSRGQIVDEVRYTPTMKSWQGRAMNDRW